MRSFIVFLLIIILNARGISQADKIDSDLLRMIESGVREPQKVLVSFQDKVDFGLLKQEFSNNRIPVSQRPKYVIQALKKVSEKSQKQMIESCINEYTRQIYSFSPFWIVNKIFIECEPSLIYQLAETPGVEFINIEKGYIRFEEPEIAGTEISERSPGLAEPGLYAINAPRMWELGYTGRGRLVYNYDTGVWPDHPAFRNRFIGNRFPMSQSWIGYSSPVPTGKINSHGTHVLGTMAGLVEDTDDTLGVAFNAYWIANDLVGTSVSSLPPIEAMIVAFEWALNPDGDINTTFDVPDVINNSWRWYDAPDQAHCGQGLIVDLMNAIEAAGIANVFAGGNFGPDNTTISSPQRINTSKVNTFSVGSVNANLNYPYPISDFSSRGPTQCDGSDNDKIHPQVVAPGEMVRSAWGIDGYNTISGTSMASPHVSGAVLLLKEAFPYLSGEELLWALFHTAIDYGESGEDNIYGNGLIDVFAAFQFLAETWEPVDPSKPDWDLSVDYISGVEENGITCFNAIYPEIHCSNIGAQTINSVTIKYWFTGSQDTMEMIFENEWLPAEKMTFILGELFLEGSGQFELNVNVQMSALQDEYDLYNNRLKASVRKFESINVPFSENFESSAFFNDVWWQYNPDESTTWEIIPLTGHDDNHQAATMQFFNYSPREKQLDQMVLFNIQLPEQNETLLSFDLAYAPFLKNSTENRDTLKVKVLDQCDMKTTYTIYEKAGDSLVTHDVISLNFQPDHPGQWRKENISLKEFTGSDISIIFESVNLKWNNLYIDNIQFDTLPFVSLVQYSSYEGHQVNVFPNPAIDFVRLDINPPLESGCKVSLWNALGELIGNRLFKSGELLYWDTGDLPAGYYLFAIEDGHDFRKTVGFVIKEN